MEKLADRNLSCFPRLNFSLDAAAKEIERYLASDRMFDTTIEILLITIYSCLIVTGMLSNMMIAGIILRKASTCRKKHPYVINLNISDLILCAFCIPFTLVAVIRRNWILGRVMCKLVPFIQGSTVFLSSATASVIAVDRHQNVINAFPTGRKRNKNEVIFTINSVWIISLILSSPVLYVQTVKNVGLPGLYMYEKCVEIWPWDNAKGIYTVTILVTQFFIPAIVLFITHLRIESHLTYAINRCNKIPKTSYTRSGEERIRKELLRNRKATIVLIAITSVFGLTWLPWNIFSLIADFYPECMSAEDLYTAFVICHIIAMTSATSNPILYGWLNSNIRKEILVVKQQIMITIFGQISQNTATNNRC